MKIYYLVCIFGITWGLLVCCSLIYVSKLEDFIKVKKKTNLAILINKTIDVLIPILLVIVLGIMFLVPVYLFHMFIVDVNTLKKVKSLYLYGFSGGYFTLLFIWSKLKKLRTETDGDAGKKGGRTGGRP